MPRNLTYDLILHLIIFQSINLLIIISNFVAIHRSRRNAVPKNLPFVSILVPTRNEETNIEACVLSLLAQDYPNFEILVLDDQSTDQTGTILSELKESYPGLKILHGEPSDGLQLGKNWACAQLAQQSKGEILFFTDADTIHHPKSLKTIITVLLGEGVDMITGYPRQVMRTWGEKLLVPFFAWAMYSFSPLILAYNLRIPIFASAVGQSLVFRRVAYDTIGGHKALGIEIVDDLALARKTAAAGLRWRVTYVADLIDCRMYQSSQDAYDGFVKNLFAAFDFRLLPFVFVYVWLGVMFWMPLIVTFFRFAGAAPDSNAFLLAICLALSVLIWWLPYIDLKLPSWLAILFPITIFFIIIVAFRSMQTTISGNLTWKGRKIGHLKWKWL